MSLRRINSYWLAVRGV